MSSASQSDVITVNEEETESGKQDEDGVFNRASLMRQDSVDTEKPQLRFMYKTDALSESDKDWFMNKIKRLEQNSGADEPDTPVTLDMIRGENKTGAKERKRNSKSIVKIRKFINDKVAENFKLLSKLVDEQGEHFKLLSVDKNIMLKSFHVMEKEAQGLRDKLAKCIEDKAAADQEASQKVESLKSEVENLTRQLKSTQQEAEEAKMQAKVLAAEKTMAEEQRVTAERNMAERSERALQKYLLEAKEEMIRCHQQILEVVQKSTNNSFSPQYEQQ
ncbi:uncharacterized protein LOC112569901 [Pomacea canaliculata]|uniref:uncharacterized protein LOC112569901 n=1 Tax=Pomacea canaliculata TaxID=400727 RepID=UPI000D72B12B|nr:uncharacterized protein LOC112569901 [Pomacea canaliculata]XP_025103754.1 uncharacterized protein LOC112569901 [Pomacea canaliculata]XP_025103755.1 uncharacterized protein LOC112569901 [Pomacea canaliculata]